MKLFRVSMFSTKNTYFSCMISGVHHKVNVNCTLLGYYAVSSGNSLPLFQDNLPVSSSRVKNLKRKNSQPLKMVRIDCPKMSVRNYHYLLHNNSEYHNSHIFLNPFHGFPGAWVIVQNIVCPVHCFTLLVLFSCLHNLCFVLK